MLPEGWVSKPLGECAKFISGGTPSKEREDYWDGDFPWVTAKDMKTLWLADTGLRLSAAGKANAAIVPPGAILVLTRGMTLLKDLPVGISKRELSFNQDIKALLPLAEMDGEFLAFQLLGRKSEVLELVDTAGHGTGRLDTEQLKQFQMNCPPQHEQRAIARVLCSWNAAICKTEKLLANSRRQKDALSLVFDWGGRRVNGRSGKVIRRHASDLFSTVSIRRNENTELLSVTQEQGVIPRRLLDRKVVMPEGTTDSYKLVEPGDFVISLRSFEGGLEYSKYRGLVSPAYTVLRAKQPICDDFYRHYFKSKDFISRLSVAVIGIRDGKQISYDDFAFLKLPSPSIEVQQKVAAVLNDAEHEIDLLTSHLEMLKAEKRALMADLLTGKRRVRMPDAMAEPEAA